MADSDSRVHVTPDVSGWYLGRLAHRGGADTPHPYINWHPYWLGEDKLIYESWTGERSYPAYPYRPYRVEGKFLRVRISSAFMRGTAVRPPTIQDAILFSSPHPVLLD